MALEKLTILVETGQIVRALFNPNQLTIQKSTNWRVVPTAERDVPTSQFTYGEPATLSMDLFFDTYEDGIDVRAHTHGIYTLTTVEEHGELHRPPLCMLVWGTFSFGESQWVLKSLNQRFTMFLENGTPVRATLGCTFRQWRSDLLEAKLLDKKSADVAKTYTVQRGDTLASIARKEYRDPALWRPIAEENRLDNPRALTPGDILIIPKLRSGATTQK